MNFLTTRLRPALLIVLLSVASLLHAQDGRSITPERMKQIKAQKSAFITQQLKLTVEEARTFWPIYDRFDAAMETARQGERAFFQELDSEATISEAQAAQLLEKSLKNKQEQLDLRKQYMQDLEQQIGALKTLQLERAERDFNRELLERIRGRNTNVRK